MFWLVSGGRAGVIPASKLIVISRSRRERLTFGRGSRASNTRLGPRSPQGWGSSVGGALESIIGSNGLGCILGGVTSGLGQVVGGTVGGLVGGLCKRGW